MSSSSESSRSRVRMSGDPSSDDDVSDRYSAAVDVVAILCATAGAIVAIVRHESALAGAALSAIPLVIGQRRARQRVKPRASRKRTTKVPAASGAAAVVLAFIVGMRLMMGDNGNG